MELLGNGQLKQVGVIVFGGGLNVRQSIDDFKQKGYTVRICDGYAELYKEGK